MSLYVNVGNDDKDHTEPGAEDELDGEHDPYSQPEGFANVALLVGEGEVCEVDNEVHQERVLKKRIDHCCELARWRIVPVGANLFREAAVVVVVVAGEQTICEVLLLLVHHMTKIRIQQYFGRTTLKVESNKLTLL